MLVNIPEEYVEELVQADAIISWRATKHIRNIKDLREKLHEGNMKVADVSDKIVSHVLRVIRDNRNEPWND